MNFWYFVGHSLSKLVAKFTCSFRVQNGEKLNDYEGGLVIASNHVSFLDPPFIGSAFKAPIFYFARSTLFEHPLANFILTRVNALPVNQGKPELSVLKRIIALLKEEEKVLIFPEGERSYDGQIKAEGQPGIGMIVTKAGVPVLPVRLFGPEKALPRGGKKLKKHPVTLVVGEPVDLSDIFSNTEITTKERYEKISLRIMEEITKLELVDSRGE